MRLAVLASLAASLLSAWANSGASLGTYVQALRQLREQESRVLSEVDPQDRRAVREYFSSLRNFYIVGPWDLAFAAYRRDLIGLRQACEQKNKEDPRVGKFLALNRQLSGFDGALKGDGSVEELRRFALEAQALEEELAGTQCGDKTLDSIAQFGRAPRVPNVTESGLSEYELGMMLNNRRFSSQLASRRGATLDDNTAIREEDAIASIADTCKQAQLDKQKKANPLSKTVVTSIVKAMKCSVIPALTTNFLDTEFQKMSLGLAAADVQGDGWDVNCDPKEIALWDSMRPLDPAEIDKRWGISAMANPAYINNLRMLPPIRAPFPVVSLPSGGFVTPFGNVGVAAQPGSRRDGVNVVANIAGTDPRSQTLVRTGRAASRGGRSYRGLAQGASLVTGTRRLAGNIVSGRNTVQSAATLRSGASNTRRLAETMVSNNRALGANGSRQANARSAATARVSTRALAGTRASRTTAESMANRVAGRGSRVDSTSPRGPGVDVVDNRRRANEQERRRIEQLIRLYQSNIEEAVTKSQSVQIKIQEKIAERDAKVNGLMEQIINKAPRTQAKKIQETRLELMNLDKELASMKAEYDVFASSVADQAALIQTLVMFGPEAPNFPGFGGRPNPRGFPTVNTGGSRGSPGRSGSLDRYGDLWAQWFADFWIRSAWAATARNLFGSEDAWAEAWQKFQEDLTGYANLRAREDQQQTRELVKAWKERSASITEKSARDFDTDTLTTMEMYSQALVEELGDLSNRSTRRELQLDKTSFDILSQARVDAEAALEALDTVALQYRDSMPKSDEDNPEVWWSMAQELMVQ
jgi:hypothetical protein